MTEDNKTPESKIRTIYLDDKTLEVFRGVTTAQLVYDEHGKVLGTFVPNPNSPLLKPKAV